MARLEIHTDDDVRIYEILDDRVLIGDVPGADLRLRSDGACVRITRQSGAFILQAPRGRNVLLNGDLVVRHPLRHEDRFVLGSVRLVFCDPRAAAARMAPANGVAVPEPEVEPTGNEVAETEPAGAQEDGNSGAADPIEATDPAEPESAPTSRNASSTAAIAAAAAGDLGTASIERKRRAVAQRKAQAKAAREPGSGRERLSRSRGRGVWAHSGVILLTVALAVLGWRVWFAGGMGESAPALMQLARNQASNEQFERALATLDQARRMAADASMRAKIDALQASIEKAVAAADDAPELSAAQVALTELNQFEAVYLLRRDRGRPAARELVRRARRWLAEHEAVASRHRISQPAVEEVESMIERYSAKAELDHSDMAADVLFAAKARLDLRYRRYPEAERILRSYLESQPADAAAVRERLEPLDQDGRRWLSDQLRAVRALEQRGDRESAVERLERLRSDCALPEWRDLFEPFGDLTGK